MSFQHEKQKLQEEALETLKSIALLSPVYMLIFDCSTRMMSVFFCSSILLSQCESMCKCSLQVTYRQHYFDTTMKALKDIVMANYGTPSPKLYFRAKCLDCMSNLFRKVDPDKFEEEEAVEVSISADSVLWFSEGKLVRCFTFTDVSCLVYS